tara:strand:- start:170 stop:364 length:195 start_codon:yes stop_codon:yes gene_type:complete
MYFGEVYDALLVIPKSQRKARYVSGSSRYSRTKSVVEYNKRICAEVAHTDLGPESELNISKLSL